VAALIGGRVLAAGAAAGSTLVERWDGTRWSRMATPSPGERSGLATVVADDSGQAWAIGSSTVNGVSRTLIERACL
jgi:hypothetical protein